jgi:hypothetical protein
VLSNTLEKSAASNFTSILKIEAATCTTVITQNLKINKYLVTLSGFIVSVMCLLMAPVATDPQMGIVLISWGNYQQVTIGCNPVWGLARVAKCTSLRVVL